MWAVSHAVARVVGDFVVGLDGSAGALEGAAAAVGRGTVDGVAVLAAALGLLLADKATLFGATEAAMRSIWKSLAI